jgi:hypothetical protein
MRLRSLAFLIVLMLPAAVPAAAQDYPIPRTYGHGYRTAGIYDVGGRYGGFAQPFIQGDYIGAPFTAVPRPSHLVPTPWSYGTYGVPTVSGIPGSPTGAPTLTVIHAPSAKKGARRAVIARGDDPADVRVVNVSVPRR